LKVEFKSSFAKDLRKIKERKIRQQVLGIIELVEKASDLQEISKIKKLQGADNYFRIKMGDYRIGLILEQDSVLFVRFLHRKDIYRYFP
jgi:mRNA interferase RelE/StbE